MVGLVNFTLLSVFPCLPLRMLDTFSQLEMCLILSRLAFKFAQVSLELS